MSKKRSQTSASRELVPTGTRAPVVGTSSTGWGSSTSWVGGGSTDGGYTATTADAEAMIRNGYDASWLVRACLDKIAETVSNLPFRAGPDEEDPSNYSETALLGRLLGGGQDRPNPDMSTRQLLRWSVLNYKITGRFAWEVERAADGKTPLALWALKTGALDAKLADGGRRYFSHFLYRVRKGAPVRLEREQVVYAWNASPDDPRVASSPLGALMLNANLAVSIDRYNYGFIKNDARPATMIFHGPFENETARNAFFAQLYANHRGPENAGKTMAVEVDLDSNGTAAGVVDVKVIGLSAKDSQQVEIARQQISAICGGLGVPYGLLDASGRTYDNASTEVLNFYQHTITPLLADLQDHINRDLAPLCGSEVGWFDLTKVAALRPRLSAGVALGDLATDMTRDERRAFAGLNPLTDTQRAELEEEDAKAAEVAAAALAAATVPALPAGTDPAADAPTGTGTTTTPAVEAAPKRAALPAARTPDLARRAVAVGALAGLIGRQLAALDAASLRACLSREKRARQALAKDPAERAAAVFEETRSAEVAAGLLAPVYDAALGSAATALGLDMAYDERAAAWVDQASARHGGALAAVRALALRTSLAEVADVDGLEQAITLAHVRDPSSTRALADLIYDSAERFVLAGERERVRALLVLAASGEHPAPVIERISA